MGSLRRGSPPGSPARRSGLTLAGLAPALIAAASLAACGPADSPSSHRNPPESSEPAQVHFQAPADRLTVRAGSVLRFHVTARLGTVTSVLLEATELPTGAKYDPSTGQVEYRPDYDQLGQHRFAFRDAVGQEAATEIQVDVVPLGWVALGKGLRLPTAGPIGVDPVDGRLLVFGAFGAIYGRPLDSRSATANSSEHTDGDGWRALRAPGTGPTEPRTVLVDGLARRALVLSADLAESFILDLRTFQWQPVKGTAPVPRERYATAMETGGGRAFLFGGIDEQGPLNDLYSVDLVASTWSTLKPTGAAPRRRAGAAMLFDAPHSRLIIAGGDAGFFEGKTLLRDVWHVDFTARRLTWAELNPAGAPPPARADFTSAHDVINDRLLLWGGVAETRSAMADPWELRLGASEEWRPLVAAGAPLAAVATHASFDDVVGRVVMVVAPDADGVDGPLDLWELSF